MAFDPSMLWHVRGAIPLNAAVDRAALLGRVAEGLRRAGICVDAEGALRLRLRGGADSKYNAFAFIDGGDLWLDESGGRLALRYDFPTVSSLRLCAAASVLFGGAMAYMSGDALLIGFGIATPIVWLYGANYVTTQVRVIERLRGFCVGRL